MPQQTLTALDGVLNFRDLGGLPLTGGGTTAPGVLARSAGLDQLTAQGVTELRNSSIGRIIDLRTATESERAPDAVPASSGVTVEHLPILGGAMDAMVKEMLPTSGSAEALTPEKIAAVMQQVPSLTELYQQILASSSQQLAQGARALTQPEHPDRAGILIHCTAGKDRTGVLSALLLSLAGVERAAIVADYAKTQDNLAGPFADQLVGLIEATGITANEKLVTLATKSPREAIEAALDTIEAHEGGAAGYLRSGGLTDQEIAEVRSRLRGEFA